MSSRFLLGRPNAVAPADATEAAALEMLQPEHTAASAETLASVSTGSRPSSMSSERSKEQVAETQMDGMPGSPQWERRAAGGATRQSTKKKASSGAAWFIAVMALACVFLPAASAASINTVQGDLRLALVGMGELTTTRFQGSLENLFYAHDYDGSGSWTAPEVADLLAYAHVSVEAVRPRLAAGVIHSLDVNAPHDGLVTLGELIQGMEAVGWASEGQPEEAGCRASAGFCPRLTMSLEEGGAVDACCEAWEAAFPRLRSTMAVVSEDGDEEEASASVPTTPLAPIDNGTLPEDPGCDTAAFDRCASEGLLSCSQCDRLFHCAVDGSATVFHSPHMYGDPAVVASAFLPALGLLEEYAAECRVLLRVVGSYNLAAVHMGAASGHALLEAGRAHALAFDVKHSRGFCDGGCLAARYHGDAAGAPTSDLACFVDRLVGDSNVTIDATHGWMVPAPGNYSSPADAPQQDTLVHLALQHGCLATAFGGVGGDAMSAVGLPVTTHSTVSIYDGPRMQSAVWNASVDCARAAAESCPVAATLCHEGLLGGGAAPRASSLTAAAWSQGVASCVVHAVLEGPAGACGWSQARALDTVMPACAASAGLCLLDATELTAAADSLASTAAAADALAAFCTVARRCPQAGDEGALAFTQAVASACTAGVRTVAAGAAPAPTHDSTTVVAYPSGALVAPASTVPVGATFLTEYHGPGEAGEAVAELAPLLDVASAQDGAATVLAAGVRLWDVLSKHDELLPSLRVTRPGSDGDAEVRNRYVRAHPDLVACVSALQDVLPAEPIDVVRFYETHGEADSVYRTGSAVAIAPGHGGTPAQLLQLAEAAADLCLPLARRRIRRGLGLGLGPRYLEIVFLRLPARNAPALRGWTVEDGGATGREPPLPAADFDALMRGFEARAGRRLLGEEGSCEQPLEAAEASTLPARTSPHYNNGFSPLRHGSPVVDGSSEFCTSSAAARAQGYLAALADVERLYEDTDASDGLRPLEDVRAALKVCYQSCDGGALFGGDVGERAARKIQACDALVHWLPVALASPRDTCHLHTLVNARTRESACFWGQCLSRQPLYALLSGHFRRFFRAPVQQRGPLDPEMQDPAPLFEESQNPTPLFALLSRVHAMECRGRVTVWAEDAGDLLKQKESLQAAMVFNPHVSSVDVRTPNQRRVEVVTALENLILEWRGLTCPARGARRHVAPYTVAGTSDAALGV